MRKTQNIPFTCISVIQYFMVMRTELALSWRFAKTGTAKYENGSVILGHHKDYISPFTGIFNFSLLQCSHLKHYSSKILFIQQFQRICYWKTLFLSRLCLPVILIYSCVWWIIYKYKKNLSIPKHVKRLFRIVCLVFFFKHVAKSWS